MANSNNDAPEKAQGRSLEGDAAAKARNVLTAESQERPAVNQPAERNRNGTFDLGVPKAKEPDLGAVFKKDPEFERRFFDMTGENGNVVERPLGGLFSPDSYRNQAFRQMMGKHGTERVKETFAILEQMGKKAEWVGQGLRPDEPTFAEQNKKLDLLSNLMKPGKLEAAHTADKLLKQDGFTRTLSLEQMNDEKLLKHLADPAQRKAFIEFQNSGTLGGAYLKDNPNHKDLSPSQNLEAFGKYKTNFEEKEKLKAKPYLDEINKAGEDPTKHVSDAMRNNRVLMIGEQHSLDGPMHKFGAGAMKDLRAAGATHLAVEIPQGQLDKYNKSRDLKDLPEAYQTSDFAKMMDNARTSGMKVVGIDNGTGDTDGKAAQERDNFMAKQIKQILDSDKNNKVVYWSGMMHGADTTSGAYRSTADILRNQKVAISTTMEQSSATPTDDLTYYAKHLEKPTAISTKKTPLIAGTEVPRLGNDVQERYGMWDSVLIFPPKRK
ncbi:MAG: hypothetical protein WCT03_08405 [Candidatus Obscuribacterales bacterium]|jgi:hypothetical protein